MARSRSSSTSSTSRLLRNASRFEVRLPRARARAHARARSVPSRSCGDEADQHRNDSNHEDACRFKGFGGEGTAALQDVEDGRGLGRRAPGHSVEALLFRRAKLTRAFGNVEDDGGASSVELILEMSAARRHEVVDLIEQIEQLEGALVDVELGVIEGR
jgi:hypothetical protein